MTQLPTQVDLATRRSSEDLFSKKFIDPERFYTILTLPSGAIQDAFLDHLYNNTSFYNHFTRMCLISAII